MNCQYVCLFDNQFNAMYFKKGGEPEMEEHLKQLMQQLGHAINDTLSGSLEIKGVIAEIKREGFDALLVLEATIGFRPKDDDEESPAGDHSFSEQDWSFLKALKISDPPEE